GVRRNQPCYESRGRRLSASAFADEPESLSSADVEAYSVNGAQDPWPVQHSIERPARNVERLYQIVHLEQGLAVGRLRWSLFQSRYHATGLSLVRPSFSSRVIDIVPSHYRNISGRSNRTIGAASSQTIP
ncbi:MAG: hypothetical protein HW416_2501, partial [Chloroflexi bacterium]|nr:hypothetical protein [Chloroflexota bacterium]